MSCNIIPTDAFLKELKFFSKKYPSIIADIDSLGNSLMQNPKSGDPIGKNCYKVRMAISSKNKAKSGGARIITHLLARLEGDTLYLLKIYDKSDIDTISNKELLVLLKEIQ